MSAPTSPAARATPEMHTLTVIQENMSNYQTYVCSCGEQTVSYPGVMNHIAESLRAALSDAQGEIARLTAENAQKVYPHLLEEQIGELEGQLAEANKLLAEFVDDEPCALDHHGYCQTHNLTKPCTVAQAREFLADYAPDSPAAAPQGDTPR